MRLPRVSSSLCTRAVPHAVSPWRWRSSDAVRKAGGDLHHQLSKAQRILWSNASPVLWVICPMVNAAIRFIGCFPTEGSVSALEINV